MPRPPDILGSLGLMAYLLAFPGLPGTPSNQLQISFALRVDPGILCFLVDLFDIWVWWYFRKLVFVELVLKNPARNEEASV